MINIPMPDDIATKFDWLRELYPYAELMGTLILEAEDQFGVAEFALPLEDQHEELAALQFYITVERQYYFEMMVLMIYNKLLM